MIGKSFGIDVSHNNAPDWAAVKTAGTAFAYVRFAYGSGLRDRKTLGHVSALRQLGIPFGAYHFYRPHQSVEAQVAVFCDVAAQVGYGAGDLVPALDIEMDPIPAPGQRPTPAWSEPCLRFVRALEARFGGCLVYIRGDEWQAMGSPAWVLERPLWVPRYTNRVEPPSIGGQAPLIWQRRVGPLDPDGPGVHQEGAGALDHNYAFGELPRCPHASTIITGAPADDGDDDGDLFQVLAAQRAQERSLADGLSELSDGDSDAPPAGSNA